MLEGELVAAADPDGDTDGVVVGVPVGAAVALAPTLRVGADVADAELVMDAVTDALAVAAALGEADAGTKLVLAVADGVGTNTGCTWIGTTTSAQHAGHWAPIAVPLTRMCSWNAPTITPSRLVMRVGGTGMPEPRAAPTDTLKSDVRMLVPLPAVVTSVMLTGSDVDNEAHGA